MSESMDPDRVSRVARLANIELTAAEIENASRDLTQILAYVDQLQQVEMPADLEPFFGAATASNAWREDRVEPSSPRSVMLDNAPDADGEYYRVPPVFE